MIWYREDPFHEAAYYGCVNALILLLESGTQINSMATSIHGDFVTALHLSIYTEKPEAIKLLISKGADPNIEGKWSKLIRVIQGIIIW